MFDNAVTVDVVSVPKPKPTLTNANDLMMSKSARAKAGRRRRKDTAKYKNKVCDICDGTFGSGSALTQHRKKCSNQNRVAQLNRQAQAARSQSTDADAASDVSGGNTAAHPSSAAKPDGDGRANNSGSKTRASYTTAFKKKVLDAVTNYRELKSKFPSLRDVYAVTEAAIAAHVPLATVRSWDKNSERTKILNAYKTNPKARHVCKARYNYQYAGVDDRVMADFKALRAQKKPVGKAWLVQCYRYHLRAAEGDLTADKFKASGMWQYRFYKRNGISLRRHVLVFVHPTTTTTTHTHTHTHVCTHTFLFV